MLDISKAASAKVLFKMFRDIFFRKDKSVIYSLQGCFVIQIYDILQRTIIYICPEKSKKILGIILRRWNICYDIQKFNVVIQTAKILNKYY